MISFKKAPAVAVALVAAIGLAALNFTPPRAQAVQPAVDLATAGAFAILAGTPNITDAGNASTITGDVGLSPASGAGIGLLCSQVTGTIYSVDVAGPMPCRTTDATLLGTAKGHLTAAYNDVAGRLPVISAPTELGGTTKTPGVYGSAATTFSITSGAGTLVLDGQGDPSSIFIFEMAASGTGLTAGPGSIVSLTNGAQACNVFWRVDTATIDTGAVFKGNILALNSITVNTGANIDGRLLARNGSVTLAASTVTRSVCAAAATPTPTPAVTGTPTITTSGGAVSAAPSFPNTGPASDSRSLAPWIIIPASIVLALLSFYLIRKQRTA